MASLLGRCIPHRPLAVAKADDSLIQALLTTGRADLSARDASLGADTASLHGLKTHLRRRVSSAAQQHAASANVSDKARTSADGTINPAVFPKNEAFHRRTGRLRRGRQKGDTYERKREAKQNYRAGERARQDGGSAKGPYGMTAGVAKVKWFCGALATTAEKLSGSGTRRKDREEAFLLNVFEDFDRWATTDKDGRSVAFVFCLARFELRCSAGGGGSIETEGLGLHGQVHGRMSAIKRKIYLDSCALDYTVFFSFRPAMCEANTPCRHV